MQTTRRRFIGITAAVSAAALLPTRTWAQAKTEPVVWQGVALGADAELRLYHPNRALAESLIQKSLAEVTRLEKIFSVYQDNSQVSRLNRAGSLHAPSADLLAVLNQVQRIHRITQGAFDPTVQVLWQQFAQHFSRQPNSQTAPNVQAALRRVGWKNVRVNSQHIAFTQANMAITLNGIAQGYITDRITQLLQNEGLTYALVDMGETRHLDTHKQHLQHAKIQNPKGNGTLQNVAIPVQNQALATSSGFGTPFDVAGKFTHLFDPRTGSSAPRYQSVSVLADNAALADALSTAFAVSSESEIQAAIQQTGAKAWLVLLDGSVKMLG
ncbi:FAD:protein FMN transferase [Kingella kingae]|uniref:FAD:protein FMN transferase n=2 Tax=Kingella kingae TaxID=504 RepID=F5S816_KINKI|nr:FAD:protein FMN transferase [Kingella kingae]EGK08337.1 NosX protein [Kingella kingae ATCC 23330]MDK4534819.1 FAD:protein FMN transferase [Kingella kingae]MDK4541294.1 FAD:protein FMN transferase [Kingella kingae]MDK4553848.1 FAD:protein FMN transferase [Kingella kingae]UOP02707.1 FAD:protein FMN transferase [Kingella kingae]